jgi:hypothetical protein
MIKQILVILLILSCITTQAQEKVLVKGMKIGASMKVKKNIYKIDASVNVDQPVIIIEGENITIDFNNAMLQGSNLKKQPDEFFGVAILIRNSKNITIKNLKAKGYKIALMATNVESLTIENCNFSYNYRQHLNSTQEKEDLADWMSYHQNEKDEWLRYGAAMYLKDCDMAIIRNCNVTGGQNALMMTNCDDALIYNNDFSFNSGIGLGMYRCERNKVLYNKINFNVRGYSHGVYNRGQDSAGILVYEQSNENLFYKNSVTHGGDGFFLWAGQTTMDSGKGGCNDNILLSNDFSYAPTNGIEVTFSRNKIIDNRIYECDHGIWGGYSYQSVINKNKFRNNRIAIAIEHGQTNMISYNVFYKDKEAIRLWSREKQPADWGYAKNRDTKSRDYIIASNSFNENDIVFNISRTRHLNIFSNTYSGIEQVYKTDSTVTGLDTSFSEALYQKAATDSTIVIPTVQNPINAFKGNGLFAGRKNIMITEWGPYDFRSPVIWNTNPADSSGIMQFDLLGPAGKWKIKSVKGLDSLSARSGNFPSTISAKVKKEERTDIYVELEYTGGAITTPFGQINPAGKPYIFTFKKFFQPIRWAVNWYAYDSISDPLKAGSSFSVAAMKPVKTELVNQLSYAWWGGIKVDTIQYPQFITIAEGDAEIKKGVYLLGVTWDDAVRVYVDGKLVLDEWDPSLYQFDESPHKTIQLELGGRHHFKVEHVEKGGFATLGIRLNAVR